MDIGFAYLLHHKLLKENQQNQPNQPNQQNKHNKIIEKELYSLKHQIKIKPDKLCERCGQLITFCDCSNISSNK